MQFYTFLIHVHTIDFSHFIPACPKWDKVENSAGDNGAQVAGVSTESACKAACIANPACAGFDLDTTVTPNTCWLHTNVNNFTPPRSRTGVNLYKLTERCPSGTNTRVCYSGFPSQVEMYKMFYFSLIHYYYLNRL